MLIVDGTDDNEHRADLGHQAVRAATDASELAVTAIEDTLAWIAQLCDRCGLPPAATFRDALRRYHSRLESGPRCECVADGTEYTLEEIHATPGRGRRRAS